MKKSEFRVVIRHCFLRKNSITQTKERLDKYYGDSAPSISMDKKWFKEFRCEEYYSLVNQVEMTPEEMQAHENATVCNLCELTTLHYQRIQGK